MRKKRLLVLLVIAAAAAGAALLLPPPRDNEVIQARHAPRAQAQPADAGLAQLPPRETIGRPGGALFSPQSWTAPPKPVVAEAPPPVKPAPPPMPYRVAGQVSQDGLTQIVLARGDAVLTVREGDTLDGGYRVEAIRADRVTLLYVPLDTREDLPVNSTLAVDYAAAPAAPALASAPRVTAAAGAGSEQPARLRWDGPQRVNAGTPFDVALKLTSAEAVRAAPLQLNYDASVLEAVSVRAGGFFSDGLFSYRMNPGGSIFIGAAAKGSIASDAELVIVRFKPLRATASAELKLSSVSLQAPSGRAITHEQPVAFRTVVVQ